MGHKKHTREVGLTKQLKILSAIEENRLTKQATALTRKLADAVELTSSYLEEKNNTKGTELISVFNANTFYVTVSQDDGLGLAYSATGGLEVQQWAAYVNVGLALIPELHSLAVVYFDEEVMDLEDDEVWVTVTPSTLFDGITFEDIEDGTFEADHVQPILDWLELLRSDEEPYQPDHLMEA